MVTFDPHNQRPTTLGIDRVKLRLLVLGILTVAAFFALFSRLWFLQVLAADDYRSLAKENRVRRIQTEPPRGQVVDRDGEVLVDNRKSLSVTIDKQSLTEKQQERVLKRVSKVLDTPVDELRKNLNAATVSPYKPVAVANDVSEREVSLLAEYFQDFPGVDYEKLPVRVYPFEDLGAQLLGYVNEISQEELDGDFAKGARPIYHAGDLVGKAGLERSYDRYLRGRPGMQRVIVNSTGKVVERDRNFQLEQTGNDLQLHLDADIQKLAQDALLDGINAARVSYEAPAGSVVVMDPNTGGIVAMASYPNYNANMLADGITTKEFDSLGQATLDDPDDDAMLNRAVQLAFPPGSTFKPVTAGAAMWSGVASSSEYIDCPGSAIYPPEGGPGSQQFNNWTSLNFGSMGFAKSLEVSCDTFYYELGWRMSQAYGPVDTTSGDGTEKFQKYARLAGLGHETGIDLPIEADGVIPDLKWCKEQFEATKDTPFPTCAGGWLPGFSVNMAIGQGDVITTPLQMAVTYAAIANGGKVMEPHLAAEITHTEDTGYTETVRTIEPEVVAELPLDPIQLGVIHEGLEDVISGAEGTAAGAFAGFPLDRYPLAGKTGTAEIGETGKNFAWFVSYGPTATPEYVISVVLERAGHGGESAAPVARQIWEGIAGVDDQADVHLGTDSSN